MHREQETLVNFDYAARRVIIYTTRNDVYLQILKRIGGRLDSVQRKTAQNAYEVIIPMDMCRKPWLIIGTERTEEQVEQARERGRKAMAAMRATTQA